MLCEAVAVLGTVEEDCFNKDGVSFRLVIIEAGAEIVFNLLGERGRCLASSIPIVEDDKIEIALLFAVADEISCFFARP